MFILFVIAYFFIKKVKGFDNGYSQSNIKYTNCNIKLSIKVNSQFLPQQD